MTDHYAEAERLLAESELERETGGDVDYAYAPDVRRELRDRATVHAMLASFEPFPSTAEDLRDAEAEIARLTHLLGSYVDGHRCTCKLIKPADFNPESMTPAEWEQDPWCPTHPDMDYILAAVGWLRGQEPPSEALVEKVAREIAVGMCADRGRASVDLQVCDTARAVLAAIGGE